MLQRYQSLHYSYSYLLTKLVPLTVLSGSILCSVFHLDRGTLHKTLHDFSSTLFFLSPLPAIVGCAHLQYYSAINGLAEYFFFLHQGAAL